MMSFKSFHTQPFRLIQLEKIMNLFGEYLGSNATIWSYDATIGKYGIQKISRITGPHKKIAMTLNKIAEAEMVATTNSSIENNGFHNIHGFYFWPKGIIDISEERHAIRVPAIEPSLEEFELVLAALKRSPALSR